jgi:hypothetical protein
LWCNTFRHYYVSLIKIVLKLMGLIWLNKEIVGINYTYPTKMPNHLT